MSAWDYLRGKVASPEELEEARKLLEGSGVRLTEKNSFWKGEMILRGFVQDGLRREMVMLRIRDGEPDSSTCTCGQHLGGLCRHGAALFVYEREAEEKERMAPRTVFLHSTSSSMRRLLTLFREESASGGRDGKTWRLGVRLKQQKQSLSLLFFLEERDGTSTLLTDLRLFLKTLEEGGLFRQRPLEPFLLTENSFREESSELLRFLRLFYEVGRREGGEMILPSYEARKERELFLTETTADAFFRLPSLRSIDAETDGGRKRLFLKEGLMPLSLQIQEEEDASLRISSSSNLRFFDGRERAVLLASDGIYLLNKREYRREVALLKEILRDGSSSSLRVSAKDRPLFFHEIYHKTAPELHWEKKEGLRIPPPLRPAFRLDWTEERRLRIEPVFRYGQEEIPEEERDKGREEGICSLLRSLGFHEEGGGYEKRVDTSSLARFLEDELPLLQEEGEVWRSEEASRLRIRQKSPLTLSVRRRGGILELLPSVTGLTDEEMRETLRAYRQKKQWVRLRDQSLLRLQDIRFGEFVTLEKDLGAAREGELLLTMPAYRVYDIEERLKQKEGIEFVRDEGFRNLLNRLMHPVVLSASDCPDAMRPYQKEGVAWLKTLADFGFGGILADDMGLGKSLQMITLLHLLRDPDSLQMIVCPSSLIYHWKSEFSRFFPDIRVISMTGSKEERQRKRKENKGVVWVTSYELLKRDYDEFSGYDYSVLVADEAQAIKNPRTRNSQTLKGLKASLRFAMTGTPVENRLAELWSIFDFLMPGLLFSQKRFHEDFVVPIERDGSEEAVQRLRSITRPFLLRRMKKDVLSELPERTEETIRLELSEEELRVYKAYALALYKKVESLDEDKLTEARFHILAGLTRLRRICLDPGLVFENYKGPSSKTRLAMELIQSALDGGHRLLVFSQFTSMLHRLEAELKKEDIPYFILTGETTKEERRDRTEAFQRGEAGVFLISLKAGGTGLNLTAADIVLHLDPWWNRSLENQASDRVYRIGQEKEVTVCRLIAANTIEERMESLQGEKQLLADALLEGRDLLPTIEEWKYLLEGDAYGS